jgi:excisionase family DNA binding protein
MKDQIEIITVQVPARVIYDLVKKVDKLTSTVSHLKQEKHLPERFTIKEAAKELHISEFTLRNKIIEGEILAEQPKKRGKITIYRDEVIRYRANNQKAVQ